MNIGKAIRMERIFNRATQRTVIVPMDHGVTVGPMDGLIDVKHTVNEVAEGGVDAVLMHKGLITCGHREEGRDVGLIMHLSASTSLGPHPNAKVLAASVEEALQYGADGVSIHVNLGADTEGQMLADLGRIARDCEHWGMPLLAMVYARGPLIKDSNAPDAIAHSARVAMELGADIVKVPYTGDMDSFAYVCESCCIPVVIAGGPKMDTSREIFQMVHDSIRAGGAGLSLGRNLFQHPNPRKLSAALAGIVHSGWDVDQALTEMGEK